MENEQEIRLRRQIEELVRSRLSILETDISHLQREVNESFTKLLERTDATATLPDGDEALAKITAEVTAQIDTASTESVRLGADIALLKDSVAELDEQRTQADVLNALVARAENFAPRVVLFVVKGQNALAWAARGFDNGVNNNSIRGLSISLQADTALRAGLDSKQTFYGPPDQQVDNSSIFTHLGDVRPERVLAVPLKVRGKTAAVLYADSADRHEGAINVEAIELLVYTSGLVVELVSLRARVLEGAKPPVRQAGSTGTLAQPAASEQRGDTPSQAAQQASTSGALNPPSEPAPQPQPAVASEAQPSAYGSPTYFRPAAEPAPPSPAEEPQGFAFHTNTQPAPPPAPPVAANGLDAANPQSEEEKRLHNEARRFARLLVSEIKLYNEQKVSDGRRHNDLYDRLKEDIDRSRQMYEKRVTPTVAAKFDYFYDELVNTLAEGDPAKLGSDSPGPTVRV